jgi:hypothetical protein
MAICQSINAINLISTRGAGSLGSAEAKRRAKVDVKAYHLPEGDLRQAVSEARSQRGHPLS